MKKTVKHPCQGCVYFSACGDSNRTRPCDGRVTKTERKNALKSENNKK